jgi:hypothetical protein
MDSKYSWLQFIYFVCLGVAYNLKELEGNFGASTSQFLGAFEKPDEII